jgi:hypothetical protein
MGKPKTPNETEEARALAEVAAQRFNRYKEVFAPLEDQYIEDVFEVRDQGNYEMAGGLASAAFQPEFQKANENLAGQMFQQGVDPSSGAFQQNSAALRRAAAVRQGLGVGGAKIDNTNRFYQGLQGIIAMGQGQAGEAISGMGQIASNAEERARTRAATAFDTSSALRSGAAAGIGYLASPFVDNRLRQGSQPSVGNQSQPGQAGMGGR